MNSPAHSYKRPPGVLGWAKGSIGVYTISTFFHKPQLNRCQGHARVFFLKLGTPLPPRRRSNRRDFVPLRPPHGRLAYRTTQTHGACFFSIGAEPTWLTTFAPYPFPGLISQCNSSTRRCPERLQIKRRPSHSTRSTPLVKIPMVFHCSTRPRWCRWPLQAFGLWRFGSMKSNRKAGKATPVTCLNDATERWR
jgi:hypothetical protein